MNKKEMHMRIFRILEDILAGIGLWIRKRDDGFVRTIPGGWQELSVPLWDYNPRFEFSLTLCIRLHAAQEIVNLFSGAPAKYHAITTTTITQLAYFVQRDSKYLVTDDEDVIAVGRSLSPIMREHIVPFFDTYKDITALDRGVNCLLPSIDSTLYPVKAMTAIVLARLAGNPELDRIISNHRIAMQRLGSEPQAYDQLVEYLKRL